MRTSGGGRRARLRRPWWSTCGRRSRRLATRYCFFPCTIPPFFYSSLVPLYNTSLTFLLSYPLVLIPPFHDELNTLLVKRKIVFKNRQFQGIWTDCSKYRTLFIHPDTKTTNLIGWYLMIIRWYLMIIKIRIHAFDLDSHYIYKYNFKVVSTRFQLCIIMHTQY